VPAVVHEKRNTTKPVGVLTVSLSRALSSLPVVNMCAACLHAHHGRISHFPAQFLPGGQDFSYVYIHVYVCTHAVSVYTVCERKKERDNERKIKQEQERERNRERDRESG